MEIQGIGPLYKRTGDGLFYWQGWTHLGSVSVCAGRVGERGPSVVRSAPDERAARTALEAEAGANRAEGYNEIATEEHVQILLRWESERWASVGDLAWRQEVEEILDDALSATGLGTCDGGTFGGHRVEVYCLVVDGETAIPEIVNVLRELERLNGASLFVREGDGYREIVAS